MDFTRATIMAISNFRSNSTPLTSWPGSHCPIYALRTAPRAASKIRLRNLNPMKIAVMNITPFDRVRKHKNTKNPASTTYETYVRPIRTFSNMLEGSCKSKTWLSSYFCWTNYILCFFWCRLIRTYVNWTEKGYILLKMPRVTFVRETFRKTRDAFENRAWTRPKLSKL